MYTQECILHNPHMDDLYYLFNLSYRLLNPKDDDGYSLKKNLYIKNGYWKLTDDDYSKVIDCGENRNIFQGLASICTHRTTLQWYTDSKSWIWIDESHYYDTISWLENFCDLKELFYKRFHKATAKEIIEHFKK